MITYLPDDCDTVAGINVGHLQKYPEFYKQCQSMFASKGFKHAGDIFAQAIGNQSMDDVVDYVVQGTGYAGGSAGAARLDATIMKTKEEYDPEDLSRIPGAKEYVLNGHKYYTIPDIPALGYAGLRVFGPTNRLVVFCAGTIPQPKFEAMLEGNKDNVENTTYTRAGSLARQTIRGTAWRFHIEGRASPGFSNADIFPGGVNSDDGKEFAQDWGPLTQGMKGIGIKGSVGSRDVRGEVIIQYADSDTASKNYTLWREKDWILDSEKEAPRWFKSLAGRISVGKKSVNIVRDGLSFRSSGDLFMVRSEIETNELMQSLQGFVGAFTGGGQGSMMGGSGPGGFRPPQVGEAGAGSGGGPPP
jgi:hypothetical protein